MNISNSSVGACLALLLPVLLASCGGGGGPASNGSEPPQATNHAPIANAGADQTVYAGTVVASLDASQSSDPDNDAITFSWSIISGPENGATLTNETTVHPSLTATVPGVYKVQLIVNDGVISSIPADVTVLFAEGVLLAGDSAALAKDTVVDMLPVGVDPAQVLNSIILTRLDVFLDPAATVGQLNAALQSVQGSIVTMLHNVPTVTIAIPQPANLDALATIASALSGTPGVALVSIAHIAGAKKLPPSPAGDQINLDQLAQLIPARFPAAWNASALATNGANDANPCAGRKVSVLIADDFQGVLVAGEVQLGTETNAFPIFGSPAPKSTLHGYEVAATLAGQFDSANPTGANPFTDCLDLHGVQVSNLSQFQKMARINASFPTGKFLLNYSQGYPDQLDCLPSKCTTAIVNQELDAAVNRAYDAVDWKVLTASRWDDFLIGVAAGNEKNLQATAIYPGLGVSVADSFMSIATIEDPLLSAFVSDTSLWAPKNAPVPGVFPFLITDSFGVSFLKRYATALGADQIGPAGNVLMVGATTAGFDSVDVAETTYSDSDPDLFAVGSGPPGSGIFMPTEVVNGTSFAAPQVTGLASYLWLLSSGVKAHIPAFNDLNALPSSVTRQAILANTRPGTGVNLIDAYATILSMDAAQLPTAGTAPIRLAILDLNNDGRFDGGDVAGFLGIFLDNSGKAREPSTPDYSRFDLNGDGFTGGSRTERFDLDRVGSTQYGSTRYDSVVTQQIEGSTVSFDEGGLTDLNILCYYAYSPLYTGDSAARTQLLADICPHTVQLASESGINLDMSGLDARDGTPLFPEASLSVTTQGSVPASPPPFDFTFSGIYHPDQTLPPENFKVTGHSDGPIVAKSNSQPSSGVYSESVSCSNTGSAIHDENNNQIVPKPISLKSNASGNYEPLSTVNPATYSLSFTMQRGEVVSGRVPASSLVGLVFIQYSLHGEDEPEMEFELNDGTGSDPTPPTVANSVAFAIQKGGFFQANWNISVRCEQEFDKENFDLMASKRSGTLTVNYSVAQ